MIKYIQFEITFFDLLQD